MLFSKVLVGAATLAVATAKVILTNSAFDGIAINVPFNITWSDQSGPVTLKLNRGPALAQVFVSTIATGLTGQSFLWVPANNLPTDTYIIEIDDPTDVNYSIPFTVEGIAVASTSSSSSTSAVSSASASSSTAATTSSKASSTSAKSSSTSSTASKTATSTPSATQGSAVRNGSPLALVLMAFIAFSFLS